MSTADPLIRVQNVTLHYGVRPVLRDVTIAVDRGELVTIMGPNGMGKSTLLGVMAGVLWPLRGFIEVAGRRRRNTIEEEREIRRQLLYLPATPWLPEEATARQFILALGRLYDIEDERLMDHTDRLLRLFSLTDQGDAPIGSLSTGQQKKVALAAALAAETPIMVLDEPFAGGLDPSAIIALQHVMVRLVEQRGATIVMATPVPELVEDLSDRIAVLRDGQLVAYDSPIGLRQSTGCNGTLGEVLEAIIAPHTLENLDHYFERQP